MTRKPKRRRIRAAAKEPQQIIAMSAPVTITAADSGEDGKPKGPPKFEVVAYTGGAMSLGGWDLPLVVDLDGMSFGKSLVANLDHDSSKRVGNVTSKKIEDGQLVLGGTASAATESRREVIESAAESFVWQASIEASPDVVTEVAEQKQITVNGQEFTGPLYVAAKSTLKGFAFVSHGADDDTTVSIAATADKNQENKVDAKLTAWIEDIGFDPDNITEDELTQLKANYAGKNAPAPAAPAPGNPFEARKLEAKRRREIRDFCDRQLDQRRSDESEILAIEKMHDHAIDGGMGLQEFRNQYYESVMPQGETVRAPNRESGLTDRILQAAICQAARIPDIESQFTDRELQAAHTEFKGTIGLKQLLLLGAQSHGMTNNHSSEVTKDVLEAAFTRPKQIRGAFSTLDISTIVSATANKFIMRGWNSIDQTSLRLAKMQNVRDFKTITTVSLTDSVIYEKVGAGGEIPHGTLSELTYTNKADTYAKMVAITRQDIINDDLGALTDTPQKLGAGAMKKLNDIFWTAYLALVGDAFFASGNNNINTGVATMTEAGLDATYVIFKNQTNPDGTPLGLEPQLLLVPVALEGAARRLMASMEFNNGTTSNQGSTNIWAGRFEVLSSSYISNSSYTGNTSTAWWMLGNPDELPVIAIAALNGRVEPTVDTAEADFNTLGVQMRGYNDVGVASQEYRGGVHADGGAS